MSAILGSAKALVPVLFAAAIAALEQLGVSIDWVTATLTKSSRPPYASVETARRPPETARTAPRTAQQSRPGQRPRTVETAPPETATNTHLPPPNRCPQIPTDSHGQPPQSTRTVPRH